jgi:hypothetical protein
VFGLATMNLKCLLEVLRALALPLRLGSHGSLDHCNHLLMTALLVLALRRRVGIGVAIFPTLGRGDLVSDRTNNFN